jgi:two-component system LytT family response regulator
LNNISCIIIDDEVLGRVVLKELITKHCPHVTIVGEAANITVAFDLVNEKKPDLILLDIQMPGGNGFELLKKFEIVNFEVIFVTSFDKYAINAIKFSALDYLLKPVDVQDLVEAIEKIHNKKIDTGQSKTLYINLINNLDKSNGEKRIAIHHADKIKLINLSSVICFEADSNYTYIHTITKEKYSLARVLKDFEDFLFDNTTFMRINKSAIVNLNYVKEYSKGSPFMIFLENDLEFEVSRRKKVELADRIKGI